MIKLNRNENSGCKVNRASPNCQLWSFRLGLGVVHLPKIPVVFTSFIRQIPNLLTLANLLCGLVSIHFALDPRQNLHFAAWALLLAMVFDFADGLAARALKAHSPIGAQLDSLADMVSFGAAPSFLLFQLMSPIHADYGHWLWTSPSTLQWLAFGVAISSAIRLARFNTDPGQAHRFKGLPTPANALMIASLPLVAVSTNYAWMVEWIRYPWFLVGITLAGIMLPISGLPFMALKFTRFTWQGNQFKFIFMGLAALGFAFLGFVCILPLLFLYLVISPFEPQPTSDPS